MSTRNYQSSFHVVDLKLDIEPSLVYFRRSASSELLWFEVSYVALDKGLRAKLHYTDTDFEHRLRTPPTDTGYEHQLWTPPTNTTNRQTFATFQHLDMSRCWALALRCGKFVVELLWACALVVSVAGVRSRCPCSGVWLLGKWRFRGSEPSLRSDVAYCRITFAIVIYLCFSWRRYQQSQDDFGRGPKLWSL